MAKNLIDDQNLDWTPGTEPATAAGLTRRVTALEDTGDWILAGTATLTEQTVYVPVTAQEIYIDLDSGIGSEDDSLHVTYFMPAAAVSTVRRSLTENSGLQRISIWVNQETYSPHRMKFYFFQIRGNGAVLENWQGKVYYK